MQNTLKELKAKLQSLLEQGHVDEYFVEDIRDMMLLVDDTPPQYECEELFPGTIEALELLSIEVLDKLTNRETLG